MGKLHILIMLRGIMLGLTLGLMSLDLVDLEVVHTNDTSS